MAHSVGASSRVTREQSNVIASRLTYCTNVHPAESLTEVLECLRGDVCEVSEAARRTWATTARFGVGLRLAAAACAELQQPGRLQDLGRALDALSGAVFTLNGFPYGVFHGRPVKDQVYLPDWTSEERVTYTEQCFDALAALLPSGYYGSVSSVPGQFKAHQRLGSREQIAINLRRICSRLARHEQHTGQELMLALEPEPGCLLETSAETLDFFEQVLLCSDSIASLATDLDTTSATAERALRRHIGVCLDTCHSAVEFESSLEVYRGYLAHGIRVGKVQISAGLEVLPLEHDLERLRAFDEPVYLHQVVKSTPSGLQRFDDLPDALSSGPASAGERWRVHFHVPLFTDQYGAFTSTRADVAELLRFLGSSADIPHLEIETYTWNVLPEHFRDRSLTDAIASELAWAFNALTSESP